jgi:hypothetical protein
MHDFPRLNARRQQSPAFQHLTRDSAPSHRSRTALPGTVRGLLHHEGHRFTFPGKLTLLFPIEHNGRPPWSRDEPDQRPQSEHFDNEPSSELRTPTKWESKLPPMGARRGQEIQETYHASDGSRLRTEFFRIEAPARGNRK